MSRIAKALLVTAATGMAITGAAGVASASAGAGGAAVGSPGFISGNLVQMPFHMPINVCGNSGNFLALLNPAFGNTCVNAEIEKHEHEKHHRHHHGGEED